MKTLTQLNLEREKHLKYINVIHHENLDKICNQEAIELLQAKTVYDEKLNTANAEYERTLIDIHHTIPSGQDRKRLVREKLASNQHKSQVDKATEEYNIERQRIRGRACRFRKFEEIELRLAKEYLEEVTAEIKLRSLTESSKKDPATM